MESPWFSGQQRLASPGILCATLSSTNAYAYPQSHNTSLYHNVHRVPRRRNQDISVTFYLDQSQDSVRTHANLGADPEPSAGKTVHISTVVKGKLRRCFIVGFSCCCDKISGEKQLKRRLAVTIVQADTPWWGRHAGSGRSQLLRWLQPGSRDKCSCSATFLHFMLSRTPSREWYLPHLRKTFLL